MVTSCRRGNPSGLKGKKKLKVTTKLFTQGQFCWRGCRISLHGDFILWNKMNLCLHRQTSKPSATSPGFHCGLCGKRSLVSQPHRSLQAGIWSQGTWKRRAPAHLLPCMGAMQAEAMPPKALLSFDKLAVSFTYDTREKMLEKKVTKRWRNLFSVGPCPAYFNKWNISRVYVSLKELWPAEREV